MDLRIYPLKPLVLKAYEHPPRWISVDLSGFIVDLSWMAFLTIEPSVERMVKKYFGKSRSFHFFRLNFVLSPPGKKMPGRVGSTNRAKFYGNGIWQS